MGNTSDKEISRMFANLSTAMFRALNDSMAAADIMAKKLEQGEGGDMAEYLAVLRRNQYKLMRIADNLGQLGEIGLGEKAGSTRLVELGQLCGELADTVSALIKDSGITLGCSRPAEDILVRADNADIERLLLNIISNSLLHCGSGGSIELTLGKNDDTAWISISDTGAGIGEKVLPTLFEDYLREEEFLDHGRGAGLGISAAESLAAFYGGSIVISGKEDGGTVAMISLPCEKKGQISQHRAEYSRDMRSILMGLSDFLGSRYYMPPYL